MDQKIIEVLRCDNGLSTKDIASEVGKKRASDIQKNLNKLLSAHVIVKEKINNNLYWSLTDDHKILEVIKCEGNLSAKEIATKVGKLRANDVKKNLNRLLKDGVLVKVKTNNTIRWSMPEAVKESSDNEEESEEVIDVHDDESNSESGISEDEDENTEKLHIPIHRKKQNRGILKSNDKAVSAVSTAGQSLLQTQHR